MITLIKCKLGFHKLGQWGYRANGLCSQQRACVNCGAKEIGAILHQWGEAEYINEGSCQRQRICVRCHAKEFEETQHQWGDWSHIESSCEKLRPCIRCHQQESDKNHDWGEGKPVYAELDALSYVCYTEWFCKRCNTRQESEHWSEEDERRTRMSYL